MTVCQRTQQIEKQILASWATFSCETKGRVYPEEESELRTPFQRDRDRIIHSKAFRRLKHKTQVFLSPEGDHYRTRLTHTLEVAQIARTIARALRLNEDLTEAVALGHDLGHTPFGHAGERALDSLYPGGFRHFEQSVRVVEKLEKSGKGLNLTDEVRNGIRCHTRGEEAYTPEGRIVRLADKIAYINHDIDDAVRAGVLDENSIPREITEIVGTTRSGRINAMVLSAVENSWEGVIRLSPEMWNPVAKEEEKKVPGLMETLYEYLRKPEHCPKDLLFIAEEEGFERAACDYIAGMTDHYAIQLFESLFVPKAWKYT